jgi:hypothetical protein
VLSLAIICGGTITQYFLLTLTPYAIRTLHLPDSTAMLGAVRLGITGWIGARRRTLRRPMGNTRHRNCAAHSVDARPVSRNEVAHRQSRRNDPDPGGFEPAYETPSS